MKWLQAPLGVLRATRGFLRLVRDPSKLDEVFAILDSLESGKSGKEIGQAFASNPRYADALRRRPRLGQVDLAALSALPAGTLGRAFADEMKARQLDPGAIQQRADDGTVEGYVFAHLRETHDVWHTATGFDVDVAGELGLQAFYLTQFPASLSLLLLSLGLLNTFFFAADDYPRRMDAIARGWELGRHADIFGFDWAAHWATPLDEVRAKIGIVLEAPAARPPASLVARA